ncbi:MAG: hypothetical protein OHK005_17250 [Candidatus Methylacidiphilales bacterium]
MRPSLRWENKQESQAQGNMQNRGRFENSLQSESAGPDLDPPTFQRFTAT